VRAQVTTPTTVAQVRRLLYGTPGPPSPIGRSVVGWLAADAGIVTLEPRRDAGDLTAWATAPGQPVFRLVTGTGGQGKTVLGRLVADQAAGQGWLAGFVRLPPPGWRTPATGAAAGYTTRWVQRWAEIIAAVTAVPNLATGTRTGRDAGWPAPQGPGRAGGGLPGVLPVVDYAENQAEALGDLLAQIVTPPAGPPLTDLVRVLLLARHDRDWWPQLARDHPDHAWVDPTPVRIGPLTGELSTTASVQGRWPPLSRTGRRQRRKRSHIRVRGWSRRCPFRPVGRARTCPGWPAIGAGSGGRSPAAELGDQVRRRAPRPIRVAEIADDVAVILCPTGRRAA